MNRHMLLPVFLSIVAFLFGGCGTSMAASSGDDDHGRVRAPDFKDAGWLNTDKPISIKDLKGRVVLLDFWTYCCINCMHIFPDLKYLEEKYHDQPLVVIGVHSGKFDEERDADHIRQAVLRHNISHPVAVDSEMKIWNEYGVRAWPTLVLIDSEGYAVAAYSGEGNREKLDQRIAALLKKGKEKGTLATPLTFKKERESFQPGLLEFPGKVLADAAGGRLFISDTNHHRVLISDLNGKVSQVVGDGKIGLKNGAFSSAEFHQPQGLALSEDGKTLFVADTENHALRAIDLVGRSVTTLAGTGQQSRQRNPSGPGKSTALSSPWDLARIGSRLYIAMAGTHQLWAYDLPTGQIDVFAGDGHERAEDGANPEASFAQPSGITTDGTRLYVADSEVSSVREVTIGPKGHTMLLAGSGDLFGFGRQDGPGPDARFQHPLGVAVAGSNLYVADTFNGLIRLIDLKTSKVSTLLGAEKTGSSDAANRLYEPGGLSVAGDTLYIADTNHHRVVVFDLKNKSAKVLPVEIVQ